MGFRIIDSHSVLVNNFFYSRTNEWNRKLRLTYGLEAVREIVSSSPYNELEFVIILAGRRALYKETIVVNITLIVSHTLINGYLSSVLPIK